MIKEKCLPKEALFLWPLLLSAEWPLIFFEYPKEFLIVLTGILPIVLFNKMRIQTNRISSNLMLSVQQYPL